MAEIDSGAITEAEFGAGGSPDEGPLEVRARKLSRSVVRKLSRGRPNDDGVSLGGRYDTSHEAAPGRRRFLDGWQALNDGWKNMLHISWDMHSPAAYRTFPMRRKKIRVLLDFLFLLECAYKSLLYIRFLVS